MTWPKRRVAIVLGFALLAGCGDAGDRDAMIALVDSGDFEAVRTEVAALREAGVVAPWLDYADGLACLYGGEEQLARRRLRDAAEADPGLAPDVARAWADAALVDFEAGFRDRARERMTEAVLADPTIDPGPLLDATADYLYRFRKDFEAARPLYERLCRERPEPASEHSRWVYRRGSTLERTGDIDGAIAVYEEFMEEFPDDLRQGRYARRRYLVLKIDQAQNAISVGDVESALALLEDTHMGEWQLDMQQRAEMLAGGIREQQGRFDLARQHYETVVRYGETVDTEYTAAARARLEALDAHDAN